MAGGFKRSSRFGIIGIFVVAGACVAIGLTLGSGQANPKLALGLIFAVIAVFFALLLVLQRGDLERTAGTDARETSRAAAEAGGEQVENPTTMAEPELWAALALEPIGPEAIRARDAMWGAARRSQRLGMVVVALIFLTVPAIYLTESFTPLFIGGPLIAIAAIYGSIRALAPGGEISSAYDNTGIAMKPLGLGVVARPKVGFESRGPEMAGFNARLRGPLVLDGERHGRQVSVNVGNSEAPGTSEVVVQTRTSDFSARAHDGRFRPSGDVPGPVREALERVPNSTRWNRVEVRGDGRGIVVSRTKGEARDWMCDLWLAERIAEAGEKLDRAPAP
jgi:hypothetical protein